MTVTGGPSGGDTYTVVDVEAWPTADGKPPFDVYRVVPKAKPAAGMTAFSGFGITSVTPTTIMRDQPTAVTVRGQLLIPPVTLQIGSARFTANSVSNDGTEATFLISGTILDAGTYPVQVESLDSSIPSLATITVESSTSSSANVRWRARIYQANDASRIDVNYVAINGVPKYGCNYTAGPGQDVYLDITDQIYRGMNAIELRTTNSSGSSTWGFEVREYGPDLPGGYKVHLNEVSAPNRTDTSTGTVFFKRYTFQNDSITNHEAELGPICEQVSGW
jgi:hypothetical protein